MKKTLLLSVICLTGGLAAFATPVTPSYDTFGNLAGATFGGTGNPTDPVAVKTITDGGNTITLGLAAQGRYNNPPLGSSGGVYFATTGQNNGLGGSSFQGSTWNFDFYFDATGGNYTYRLLYGTDALSLTTINPAAISDNGATPNHGGQNSQNLLFANFGGVANGLSGIFDPNAPGIYSFELQVLGTVPGSDARVVLGQVAINVDVASAPDSGSTALLLGLGFAGLAGFGYRRSLALAK